MERTEIIGHVGQYLDELKNASELVAVYPLVNDEKLALFVSAWRVLGAFLSYNEMTEDELSRWETMRPSEIWDWVWQFCNWDVYQAARFCNVTPIEAQLLCERARGFRLIFPDGSISVAAIAGLTGLILLSEMTGDHDTDSHRSKKKRSPTGTDDDLIC